VNRRWIVPAAVTVLAAVCVAGIFSMMAEPLNGVGLWSLSFWLAALGLILTGVLIAIVIVELKPVFGAAFAGAVIGTLVHALALWSPALALPHYSTRLANYAVAQSALVVMIALATVMAGALIGTLINASVREFEL
jgi:hypothetical protein